MIVWCQVEVETTPGWISYGMQTEAAEYSTRTVLFGMPSMWQQWFLRFEMVSCGGLQQSRRRTSYSTVHNLEHCAS